MKAMMRMICVLFPVLTLHAAGTNPSSGSSSGGGTNPASTSYVGSSGYNIGDFAEGGVVIWVTQDGQHGLVAAISDVTGSPLAWGPSGTTTGATNNDPLPSSTPNAPYGQYYPGYLNQQIIEGIANWQNDYPAFQACANYSITINGKTYDDWFLPSSRELSLMYVAQGVINQVSQAQGGQALVSGFTDFYWSSRENVANDAWFLSFADGASGVFSKNNATGGVRCVRAF
jgi:hypothetical protein